MPLTWFAHQAPVLPLKSARPTWFDGTALCVGSMTPDLMYSFSAYVHIDTHRWPWAFTYGVPTAIVLAFIARFWCTIGLGGLLGAAWGWPGETVERINRTAVGLIAGGAVAALLARRLRPAPFPAATRSRTVVASDLSPR